MQPTGASRAGAALRVAPAGGIGRSVDWSTGRAGDGQANCRDTAGAVAAKAALAMRARRAAKVRRDQDARFRTGQIGYSAVSVNGSWRLTFRFEGADAVLVNDQDHH